MSARKGKRAGLAGQGGARRRRKRRLARQGVRKCRRCGCTDDRACAGGCWWVEADLCSGCDGQSTLFAYALYASLFMQLGNEASPSREQALAAGYDCGLHGANTTNSHFSLFASPELTSAWEEGRRRGAAALGVVASIERDQQVRP